MKNAITVIDQELIGYFDEMLPYCSDVKPTNFPFYKIDELHKMAKDLIKINAELTKRERKYKSALNNLVQSCEINTGNEPSLSCYHRALDEAKQALKGDE